LLQKMVSSALISLSQAPMIVKSPGVHHTIFS
jgi:hypothetical protein